MALRLSTVRTRRSVAQERGHWEKPRAVTWEQVLAFCCRIACGFFFSWPEAAWLYTWLKNERWILSLLMNVFWLTIVFKLFHPLYTPGICWTKQSPPEMSAKPWLQGRLSHKRSTGNASAVEKVIDSHGEYRFCIYPKADQRSGWATAVITGACDHPLEVMSYKELVETVYCWR